MSPPPDPSSRRHSVVSTVPSDELAGLDLDQLRSYRSNLEGEEDRVSYWRRLVHARIDVLEAESGTGQPLSMEELVRVLGDTGSGRTRRALVRFRAADPLPDLPILSEMWVVEVDSQDVAAVQDALARLHTAEQQLTTYRRALHEHIDEATRELILRYRENPLAALSVIPQE